MASPNQHQRATRKSLAFCLLVLAISPAHGESSLRHASQTSAAGNIPISDSAIQSALACGGPVDESTMASTKAMLLPLWRTLPKNEVGRVNKRALQYLAHRYFSQHFNIRIRGSEHTEAMNQSSILGVLSDIVGSRDVETSSKPQYNTADGFSFEDATDLIVMLQQRIFESDIELLEHVFWEQGKSTEELLSTSEFVNLLYSYIYHWVFGAEIHGDSILSSLHNLTNHREELVAKKSPLLSNWQIIELAQFVQGQVRTMEWLRRTAPAPSEFKRAWMRLYSFSDARKIVTGITSSFGVFSGSSCQSMKQSLVDMDPRKMGRAPLSKFYAAAVRDKQHFGESQVYLRELGALDETSSMLGRQVIIPNYLQAATNCAISTAHYLICCANECDAILQAIETELGAATATPEQILGVVGNVTLQMQDTLDDDETYTLGRGLADKLEEIASNNGGQVQVHGRLFLQWLHYAFPRECAFPHKAGTVVHKTAREYGNVSIEAWGKMQEHANDPLEAFAHDALSTVDKEQLEWMSQWSSEEELVGEIGPDLQWPAYMQQEKQRGAIGSFGGWLVLLFLLGGMANKGLSVFRQSAIARVQLGRAHHV